MSAEHLEAAGQHLSAQVNHRPLARTGDHKPTQPTGPTARSKQLNKKRMETCTAIITKLKKASQFCLPWVPVPSLIEKMDKFNGSLQNSKQHSTSKYLMYMRHFRFYC